MSKPTMPRRLPHRRLVLVAIGLLACTLKDKGPLFTCKACFQDQPSWCAVYQDDGEAAAHGSEKEAMSLAKLHLCNSYEQKTDGGLDAYIQCDDRIEDDFVVTCTSRIGSIPRHSWFSFH